MNDDLSEHKFNRITLQFVDKSLEKSFVDTYDSENRVANRSGTISGIFIWAMVVAYAFMFQKDALFRVAVPVVFVLYPCFCAVIAVTYVKRFTFACQGVCAFGNLLAGLVAVYLGTIFIETPYIATIYICGYVIGAFFLRRLRYAIAVPISLTFVGIYQIVILLPHHLPPDEIFINTAAVWIFQTASTVGGYLLEKNVRRVFLQNRIIEGQRRTIEFEKEKSEALLRTQLSHAERLATMGTIVASVAHEINNPNNSLMLDAQFNQNAWKSVSAVLDEHCAEKGDFSIGGFGFSEFKTAVVDASTRMKRNTGRIKHIVENLRAIAKKDTDLEEGVQLNATVRSALSVIEHITTRHTNHLNVELSDSIPLIRGNGPCLEQVVINLVKNSCQALPDMEKGVFVATVFHPEKRSVSLTVRDEGRGMDEKTVKEIFTPFFTTKGKEGTGLGLSICGNIIKNHGGTIEVKSKIGEGTAVTIALPLVSSLAASRASS